jgi:hypothetical protein
MRVSEVTMQNRIIHIAIVAMVPFFFATEGSAAEDHLEVGAGWTPLGAKLAVAVLRPLSSSVSASANVEWSQRPWIDDDIDVDRRLAYAGVGGRLRLFPSQRLGTFVTVGLGIGRLTFPGSAAPAEWHAVPWTGIGWEARVTDHLQIGVEARIEWLRRGNAIDGELPLRITARLPLGRRGPRPEPMPPNNE